MYVICNLVNTIRYLLGGTELADCGDALLDAIFVFSFRRSFLFDERFRERFITTFARRFKFSREEVARAHGDVVAAVSLAEECDRVTWPIEAKSPNGDFLWNRDAIEILFDTFPKGKGKEPTLSCAEIRAFLETRPHIVII